MQKIINPKVDSNINQDCRLMIVNLNDSSIYKIYDIKKDNKLIFDDEYVFKNLWTFGYKLQIKSNNSWIDADNISLFANIYQIDLIFRGYAFDIDNIGWILSDDIMNMSVKSKNILSHKVINFVYNILWINPNANHEPLKKFNKYIFDNIGYKSCFLVEMCFYLEYLIKLKEILKKYNINLNWHEYIFKPLYNQTNYGPILKDLKKIIVECELYEPTIQSSNIIIGKIYDFIGNRDIASNYFKKALSFNENFSIYFTEEGISTYKDYSILNKFNNDEEYNIKFLNDCNAISDIVILYSLDLNYLRAYGPQLLYMCNIFDNQHFHFHVIGNYEKVNSYVDEAIDFYKKLCTFRKKQSPLPTFSTEEVPKNIKSLNTFYACSRFINSKYFMDHFNKDIYVLDADMLFISSPYDFFNNIKSYDISCTLNASLDYFSSYKKFQAGNIFFKKNENVKQFLKLLRNYILEHIDQNGIWTLDQNALAFAYDYFRDNNISLNLSNAWFLGLPTLQQSNKHEILKI